MKRRTFITTALGLGALVGAPVAYVSTHKTEVATYIAKKKGKALFRRFFKTATTFEPNEKQLYWFEQYMNDSFAFMSGRQTGMTTFMAVMALYEQKVNGLNIQIAPYSWDMLRRVRDILSPMEDRLGKSVKDGIISVGCRANGQFTRYDKQFVMRDQGAPPITGHYQFAPKIYSFGTYEFSVLMPRVKAPMPKMHI